MSITASEVNELRKATGAGLMDCKEALTESGGDIEAAIDYLRKKGQKISAKRADREANEGAVIALTNDDNTKGVVVYLSCETDFVAKNEDFAQFAWSIAELAIQNFPANTKELLGLELDGLALSEKVSEQVGKIGEKIEISAYETLEGEMIVPYIHAGNKIGVLVSMTKKGDAITQVGKDVAMQIAAMNPMGVDQDSVDQSVVDREIEIARDVSRQEGKAEDLVEKIAKGKLQKFFKENTLLAQQFVKDGSKTVGEMLKETDPDLTVTAFKRVAIGG